MGTSIGIGISPIWNRVQKAPGYFLLDRFNGTLSAGNVNGTLSDSGHTRIVQNDGGGYISIGSGNLNFSGGGAAWGTPKFGYSYPISRVPGRIFMVGFKRNGGTSNRIGLSSAQMVDFPADHMFSLSSNFFITSNSFSWGNVGLHNNKMNGLAVILRNPGAWYFQTDDNVAKDWSLLHLDEAATATPLYFTLSNFDSQHDIAYVAAPQALFILTPVVSDGFGGAFGSGSDGLGHQEQNGGDGAVWTNAIGTGTNTGGVRQATALSGGLHISTVDAGVSQVNIRAQLTRSAGNVGLVIRYQDTNNYIIAYHDGTNLKVDEVISGTPTNRLTTAVAYSAGAILRLTIMNATASDTRIRVAYGTNVYNSISTISTHHSGTVHGVYTTNTGNTLDNFQIWAVGNDESSVYESVLEPLVP